MGDWLTTHYPHQSDEHPWFIFLKDQYRAIADRIATGDRVVFVELSGRNGRRSAAVKCLATVTSQVVANEHREEFPEVAGQHWQHALRCGGHDFDGTLGREELNELLGYRRSNRLRIKGGICPLKPGQFDKIEAAFKSPG